MSGTSSLDQCHYLYGFVFVPGAVFGNRPGPFAHECPYTEWQELHQKSRSQCGTWRQGEPKLKKAKNAQGKNKQKTRKDKNILNLKQVLRSELKRLARKQEPGKRIRLKKVRKTFQVGLKTAQRGIKTFDVQN